MILLLEIIQWLPVSLVIKFKIEVPKLGTETLYGLARTPAPAWTTVIRVVSWAQPALSHLWAFTDDMPSDWNSFSPFSIWITPKVSYLRNKTFSIPQSYLDASHLFPPSTHDSSTLLQTCSYIYNSSVVLQLPELKHSALFDFVILTSRTIRACYLRELKF